MRLRTETRLLLEEDGLRENGLFERVLDRLCGGMDAQLEGDGKPRRSPYQVCKEMGLNYGGLLAWVMEADERVARFERALELRGHLLGEEIVEIADTPQVGVETKTKADGSVETTEGDMLGHRRLQIEARKFLASKWNRSRYGESVDHKVSGGVTVEIVQFQAPVQQRLQEHELNPLLEAKT